MRSPKCYQRREPLIFLPHLRRAEEGIAAKVKWPSGTATPYPPIDFEKAVAWCEQRTGKTLAPSQREALKTVFANRVTVITGGPGVGKTTLVNSILMILRAKGVKCLLCPDRAGGEAAHGDHWLGGEDDPPPAGDRPHNWQVHPKRVKAAFGRPSGCG